MSKKWIKKAVHTGMVNDAIPEGLDPQRIIFVVWESEKGIMIRGPKTSTPIQLVIEIGEAIIDMARKRIQ